jgi:hypothetical protein
MTSTAAPADGGRSISYPSALDELHRQVAPGELICSPSGYVLASPAALLSAALPDAGPSPLGRLGLAVGRRNPVPPVPGSGGGPHGAPAADLFADGLLGLHRGLLLRVIGHVMRHLDARTSGGSTLLSTQLVQGQLADIALQLSADAAVHQAAGDRDPQARWRSYQRLVAAGRGLLRLLGASGFLAEGPAGDLHLAEIAGNVYLHPEGDDVDD